MSDTVRVLYEHIGGRFDGESSEERGEIGDEVTVRLQTPVDPSDLLAMRGQGKEPGVAVLVTIRVERDGFDGLALHVTSKWTEPTYQTTQEAA